MNGESLTDTLAGFSLFADLSPAQLESIAHTFEEEWFSEGQHVLHQGFSGTGFYVILEGEASVRIDGEERARIGRGDFFGELSILLDEPPSASIVATAPMRCVVLGRAQLEPWLLATPSAALRMLQAELRRLRAANRWRT